MTATATPTAQQQQQQQQQQHKKEPSVWIHAGELKRLRQHVKEKPNIETGGGLWGLCEGNEVKVMYVSGPGPNANHNVTEFQNDRDDHRRIGAAVAKHNLVHLGDWHSHHRLNLPHPSHGDSNTVAMVFAEPGLEWVKAFLMAVAVIDRKGRAKVRPFLYLRNGNGDRPQRPIQTEWNRWAGESPLRRQIDEALSEKQPPPFSIAAPTVQEQIANLARELALLRTIFDITAEERPATDSFTFYLQERTTDHPLNVQLTLDQNPGVRFEVSTGSTGCYIRLADKAALAIAQQLIDPILVGAVKHSLGANVNRFIMLIDQYDQPDQQLLPDLLTA